MNTYKWSINQLDCYPKYENQTNIVYMIHWQVSGTDGKNTATFAGTQPLAYVEGNPFITYENLTENTVVEWLKTAMGASQITSTQKNLDSQILKLANPSVVTSALPWVA